MNRPFTAARPRPSSGEGRIPLSADAALVRALMATIATRTAAAQTATGRRYLTRFTWGQGTYPPTAAKLISLTIGFSVCHGLRCGLATGPAWLRDRVDGALTRLGPVRWSIDPVGAGPVTWCRGADGACEAPGTVPGAARWRRGAPLGRSACYLQPGDELVHVDLAGGVDLDGGAEPE